MVTAQPLDGRSRTAGWLPAHGNELVQDQGSLCAGLQYGPETAHASRPSAALLLTELMGAILGSALAAVEK